jgi:aspartyl-tRNA(Asn)/glutamyl-tRNA(Gln) amidotransferase subunit A
MSLNTLTASEIASGIKNKTFSAVDVARDALAAVKKENAELNSYITILEESALAQAAAVDQQISKGESVGALAGVPIAIKDNMMIRGVRTTCASKIFGDYKAPYDAFVIERLKKAGAVFVGKTNMDEFAMGSSTEHSQFGLARNPWDKNCIPGGSSGGSAVTVTSRSVPLSLGSDTGGSIRQPAALCGILGMKPTYGRVSRYGLVAFASSLDQIGPFSHSVDDMALMLDVISGPDKQDSTSVDKPLPGFGKSVGTSIKGLRVGIPKEYFIDGIDPEVKKAVEEAVATLKKLGAVVKEISLPHSNSALAVYYILAPAEASSNLARFDGVRYGIRNKDAANLMEQYSFTRRDGFGSEVKRRIMIGVYALSSGYYDAYYSKAQKVRTLIKNDFSTAFNEVDVIATPVSPTPAFRIGEKVDDPLTMYLSDIFTIPANLAGIPGLSVPCGFSSKGLPIGIQFYSGMFQEGVLLQVADAYLKETGWNTKKPKGA